MVSIRPSYGGYLDEYCGLSTDSKPTHNTVVNGSTFVEMDTGKRYRYDRENKVWFEYNDDVGGGGSSVSVAPLLVSGTFVYNGGDPMYMLSVKAGELFNEFLHRSVYVLFNDGETDQYFEIDAAVADGENYSFMFSFDMQQEIALNAEGANSYPYARIEAPIGDSYSGSGDDSGGSGSSSPSTDPQPGGNSGEGYEGEEMLVNSIDVTYINSGESVRVDLSAFAPGDLCRITGSLVLMNGWNVDTETETDISHQFIWTGNDYTYTAGIYTLTINATSITVRKSSDYGGYIYTPEGDRYINFYISSGDNIRD